MKFVFVFTETATGKVTEVEGGRSSLWDAQDLAEGWPKRKSNDQRLDFAWGYFAAKNAGASDALGVSDMDDDAAITHVADNFDLLIRDNKAPLAEGRPE